MPTTSVPRSLMASSRLPSTTGRAAGASDVSSEAHADATNPTTNNKPAHLARFALLIIFRPLLFLIRSPANIPEGDAFPQTERLGSPSGQGRRRGGSDGGPGRSGTAAGERFLEPAQAGGLTAGEGRARLGNEEVNERETAFDVLHEEVHPGVRMR